MKESIVDKIMCSTGYLPPRNEEEMISLEKECSKVTVKNDFHVNVNHIVNGRCHLMPLFPSINGGATSANDMRMAARNFDSMPKDVIEKIKRQHKGKDDKGE